MKAVVVGASGFIGSHLVDALLGKGYHVCAISRKLPGLITSETQFHPKLELISCDITEPNRLSEVMEGANLVFHLACSSHPYTSNINPQNDVQINLVGSLNVLDAIRLANVKRIVFLSSGGTVYGSAQQISICESHPTEPICSYGIIKLAVEKYITLYSNYYGLEGLVLRVANPYGERQCVSASQGVVAVFLEKALRNQSLEVWGDGSVVRDFIHISDLITALLATACYEGHERIFNIGSGLGLSLNELIKILEMVLGRSLNVTYLPSRKADVPSNILNIEKAKNCLEWSPKISIVEGVSLLYSNLIDSNPVHKS